MLYNTDPFPSKLVNTHHLVDWQAIVVHLFLKDRDGQISFFISKKNFWVTLHYVKIELNMVFSS